MFNEHALHHHVTPKYATVMGPLLRIENKIKAEKSVSLCYFIYLFAVCRSDTMTS